MRSLFSTGSILALLAIYLAVTNYLMWDDLAKASVELGFQSASTLPGLVGIFASMIGAASLLLTIVRKN